jgi:hypothetical protein
VPGTLPECLDALDSRSSTEADLALFQRRAGANYCLFQIGRRERRNVNQ